MNNAITIIMKDDSRAREIAGHCIRELRRQGLTVETRDPQQSDAVDAIIIHPKQGENMPLIAAPVLDAMIKLKVVRAMMHGKDRRFFDTRHINKSAIVENLGNICRGRLPVSTIKAKLPGRTVSKFYAAVINADGSAEVLA